MVVAEVCFCVICTMDSTKLLNLTDILYIGTVKGNTICHHILLVATIPMLAHIFDYIYVLAIFSFASWGYTSHALILLFIQSLVGSLVL